VLVDIGDERTKEALMNMEIDLRTLGDKKVKLLMIKYYQSL